jgi:DNA-binding GntR family transcriptional regulator
MESLPPVPGHSSLKDQAYRAIKEAILSFQLKPGDPLVESDLASQLGISKTPVRDALFELEKEGLVTKVLFKGSYVSELTPDDVKEIFEIRAVLEGLAARLAAINWTDQDTAAAQSLVDQQEASALEGNNTLSSQMNKKFHELVITRAQNHLLTPIYLNLDDHLRRYRILSSYQKGRLEKSVEEHRQLIQAFDEKDAARAETLMRAHLGSVLDDLIHQGMLTQQE